MMTMIAMARLFLAASGHMADGNAVLRYPGESAAWIWHPDRALGRDTVLRFRRRIVLAQPSTVDIHVTADQRFQLRCDGQEVTFGPDRCDVDHWTLHTVRLALPAGAHEFTAIVWWLVHGTDTDRQDLQPAAPMAQQSWRGGFLLAAEGEFATQLTTGIAEWGVTDLTAAVTLMRTPIPGYHDVGPSFTFALDRWQNPGPEAQAAVVLPPLSTTHTGIRRPGWCLYPAELPEQHRELWTGGRIRAVRVGNVDDPWRDGTGPVAEWQQLVDGAATVTVPAHTEIIVLWDLTMYRCGYPGIGISGGSGATISLSWAEALYEQATPSAVSPRSYKGQRDDVDGKVFVGFGDRWQLGDDPAANVTTPALWWRSGRYLRLRVVTAAEPIVMTRLGVELTGYPLERGGNWQCSDAEWDRLMPLFENAFRVSAHETWTDSPYYEQMQYVGDTLLAARANYAWFTDDRLSRRAVRLFEWSRLGSGMVAERYPSAWRQESVTYALLWPLMVRDYAWWRGDMTFVRSMLPGLRAMLAEIDGLAGESVLLRRVPGWSFVDWVPQWENGCGPGVTDGDSSIVNLHWVLALQAASDVERAYGDADLAHHYLNRARRVLAAIIDRYWDSERGVLLDTTRDSAISEHAHAFALLTRLLDPGQTERCLAVLRSPGDIAAATIYFSAHVLDALYLHGESDAFHARLRFWRGLVDQGFTATPEQPEPSRSDAHAWGAHPAWHTLASIAGVRPASPGFSEVAISPMPGSLSAFDATVVHPRGKVGVRFERDSLGLSSYQIALPDRVTGRLVVGGMTHTLKPGETTVRTI